MLSIKYKTLFSKLLLPFTADFWCFAVIFLLISTPDVFFTITNGMLNCTFYNAVWNFVCAYCVVLILSLLLPRWLKLAAVAIVLVPIVAMAGIDFVSVFTHKVQFNSRIASSIVFTNPAEAAEFWHWGVSALSVVSITVFTLLLAGLVYAIRRFNPGGHRWFRRAMCGILALSVLVCVLRPKTYDQSYINKIYVWKICVQNLPPDLRGYMYSPELEITDTTFADDDDFKLVFIIGESLTASHIPFYGYDKNTMPRLSERVDSGDLVYFRNVTSPAIATDKSFPLFMTDKTDYSEPTKWWEHIKITDAFRTAGYKLNWLSNQSKSGLIDGAQVAFSKVCDKAVFAIEHQKYDRSETWENILTYDECIFPFLEDMHRDDSGRTMYLINLYGLHHTFSKRYPPERAHFTAADYADRPEQQRETLSAYDNALYYNDFVVDSIINVFADDDAIIVYFPDHGLDIFESDPTYAFNGIESNPASVRAASAIPLMIVMTDKYKSHHPATAARITDNADRISAVDADGFNTTNAIYLLLDLAGLRLTTTGHDTGLSPLSPALQTGL